MSKKPLIGIPLWNQGENSVGVTKPYLEWAKRLGTIVILSPDTFIPELDLLILPGGKDIINSSDYTFSYWNSDGERFLEYFDVNTLPLYIQNETPIWGICRGFQSLLRTFGSNLIQHITWDHGYSKDESDVKAHKLAYTEEGMDFLNAISSKLSIPKTTGSWHHQCVKVNEVPNDFITIAMAEDLDNPLQNSAFCAAEYVIHRTLPFAGVQAHSERTYFPLDFTLVKHIMNLKK